MAFEKQLDSDAISQSPQLKFYSQLSSSKQEIRLIRLGDNITLDTYSLNDAPPYHAISYYWGPPEPKKWLSIQGEAIEVRDSVAEMLATLQALYAQDELFWVDMFCINQRDLQERNSQVSMMAEIYAHATDAMSWIGPSTMESRHAYRIVTSGLKCPPNAPWRMVGNDIADLAFPPVLENDWPSEPQLESDHAIFRRFAQGVAWPAFADVLTRPYWERMWVVQEMITAKKSLLLCGRDLIQLEDFVEVGSKWVWMSQHRRYTGNGLETEAELDTANQRVINVWRPVEKIAKVYRPQYRDGSILLMELVDSFATRECTNLRDKVYSLRSLSKEAEEIKVDYSKSMTEVFLDLVRSGLLTSNGGNGFQSLNHLITHMGFDHDELEADLAQVPSLSITVHARCIGWVADIKIYPNTTENHKTAAKALISPSCITITSSNGTHKAEKHWGTQDWEASLFLQRAQRDDMLCVVHALDTVLLLLRPSSIEDGGEMFQAVDNLTSWRHPLGQPKDGQHIHTKVSEAGHIAVASPTDLVEAATQCFAIDSRSLLRLNISKGRIRETPLNYALGRG